MRVDPADGPPTLETARLVLRAPRAEDVDPLFEIQGNVEAMQHVGFSRAWYVPELERDLYSLSAVAWRRTTRRAQ